MDKHNVKKFIGISAAVLGTAFIGASIVAKKKKPESVYADRPDEKNKLEGKKVILVEDENDSMNADGVRGHLEVVGESEHKPSFYEKYVKRGMDIALSFGGLVALSPVLGAISLAIKINDPGPVFFGQKRVGKNKQYFILHKFRTMKMCTPHDKPTHMLENPDQYITRVGKFLRKHSLDELPQIWDIFMGNMSVIGPRPGLWNQDYLTAERDKYGANDVKPGLTGLAQINGRDAIEIEEKAKFDGEYCKNIGLKMDAKVFMGSLGVFAKDDNVVEGGTGAKVAQENHTYSPRVLLVANVGKEHVLKFHIPTIKYLKEQGWYVDVACAGEDEIPYCDHQYKMSYKRSPFNPNLIVGISELKKIIDKGNYDVVYCHTPVGGLAGRLASVDARKKGTKVVYMAHGYHFFKGAPKKNWMLYYNMEKQLAKLTDAIILINNEDYEITKRDFKECQSFLINGIGVDFNRFKVENPEQIREEYRKQMGIPQDATVLIYLAELLPNKNQTMLMRVLKKLLEKRDDVYLVLAGFDHSNGEFMRYAEQIGVSDHIRYLGWREDVGNLYTMADICTATSIREGFGLNLVEAMYCGIPVVATRNRGHETIIQDGVNGYLVDLGDEEKFLARVEMLIDDHKVSERFMGEGLKDIEKYDSESITKSIEETLRSVIGCDCVVAG